jgi:threonine/homoserine/homoserine lactone efflux protein
MHPLLSTESLGLMGLFAQALLIGVSIAAPVGPIGLLTIQRSLDHGPRAGLATGLGAAVADAFYGALGAYGVSSVIRLMSAARLPLGLGGAAFLLWMAWGLWRAPLAEKAAELAPAAGLWRFFSGTVLLTLSNPATIFSFMAVFGALAARAAQAPPWLLVLGVFLGSAAWWLFLSALVGRLRERFDARWRRWVQRTSSIVLTVFSLWQLAGLPG